MKIYSEVTGFIFVETVYTCATCGTTLHNNLIHYLKHPDRKAKGWFSSMPIECEFAGKKFRRPMIEIEQKKV